MVRDLDANRRATGNRGEDPHVGGCECIGDVAVQARDARHLHTGAKFEFVARDGRPNSLADQPRLDPVRRERLDEDATTRLDLGLVDGVGRAAR